MDVSGDRMEREVLSPAMSHFGPLPSLIDIKGKVLVIGDLHGDIGTATRAIGKFEGGDHDHLLFLGDYVDRGKESLTTINMLLELALGNRGKVHLLRGNHEVRWVNKRFGFYDELRGKGLEGLYQGYNELFATFPVAAVIDGKTFAVHGGVPEPVPELSTIRGLPKGILDPDEERDGTLIGLLWNDPSDECDRFGPNEYRGYGGVFGRRPFERFLDRNGLDRMVRGHTRWKKGYGHYFDKQVLSVFSSTSYEPDITPKAAVIDGSLIDVVPL